MGRCESLTLEVPVPVYGCLRSECSPESLALCLAEYLWKTEGWPTGHHLWAWHLTAASCGGTLKRSRWHVTRWAARGG